MEGHNNEDLADDKWRATVIINTTDYDNKIAGLLVDVTTYEKRKRDPTRVYKSKLVNTMKEWKRTNTMSDALYYKIYPVLEAIPKFYGLPKIHKDNIPVRPIESRIGSITYKTAKYLAMVLSLARWSEELNIL